MKTNNLMKKSMFLLLIVSFLFISTACTLSNPQKVAPPGLTEEEFPKELAELPLAHIITGDEAKTQISQLHGTDIEITEGLVAMFGAPGDNRQMMMWISESATKEDATKLLDIMNEKMLSNKVFSNFQEKDLDGLTYYYVSGIGLDNYYYQKDKRLYWIGINDSNSEAILQQIIDKI